MIQWISELPLMFQVIGGIIIGSIAVVLLFDWLRH